MIDALFARLEARAHDQVWVGLDAEGRRDWSLTGADVLRDTARYQSQLQKSGVGAGDRVAIDVARGPALLPAHLAVLGLGACAVPINPALRPAERERVMQRADLRAVLRESPESQGQAAPLLRDAPAGAPALLIFTSGTTGEPKGVPLSRENLAANLDDLQKLWALGPGDRLLHVLPAHHVHGLVLALYGGVRAGADVVLAPRFETEPCLRALADERIRVLMAVPTVYHRLARAEPVPALPEMRLFVSGSAPLSPEDFTRFAQRFGHVPLERYGLSETLIVSSNPLHGERRAGTVGAALPSAEVRLASDGEIEVRGPSVMSGYWRDAATNEAAFRDGYFLTGDLGRMDDGYLVISGRKKELIIVGGSNVLPGEVERALEGDRQVEELAAVGLPDPERGEHVALFVVASRGADPATLEQRLRARAEDQLAAYKRPRTYRFVSELPRNAMGKIDRKALRGASPHAPACP